VKKKKNYFAPEWEYTIIEKKIKNVNFKELSVFLLDKEKEILLLDNTIKQQNISDGYTGLGKNSTTSRFDKFNVFNWENKELTKIKNHIINLHNELLTFLKISLPKSLYIQCWVNIMKKGEQIKPHIHGVNPDTYLGGHICVQCDNTSTYYINPVNQINDPEIYSSKNEDGKITLFQNCIPHYTDVHNSDEKRVTIAFDLSLKSINNFIKIL
jgi:hypothetical protein